MTLTELRSAARAGNGALHAAKLACPTPDGTRDLLPADLRRRRRLEARLLAAFEARGYLEVDTPRLENDYAHANDPALSAAPGRYRVIDTTTGTVLRLRADMSTAVARLVATRYTDQPPPFRVSYVATVFRSIHSHRGDARELRQAGTELIGVAGHEGTAETIELLYESLRAAGVEHFRIGLGHALLYERLLDDLDVPAAARERLLRCLSQNDLVGLDSETHALGLPAQSRRAMATVSRFRGPSELLPTVRAVAPECIDVLEAIAARLRPETAAHMLYDLGVRHGPGYYNDAVFEVYAAGRGAPIGGGGRYDKLCARFGRPLPAVGFALDLDALGLAIGSGSA